MTYTEFLAVWLPVYHLGDMPKMRELRNQYPQHFERFIKEAQQ